MWSNHIITCDQYTKYSIKSVTLIQERCRTYIIRRSYTISYLNHYTTQSSHTIIRPRCIEMNMSCGKHGNFLKDACYPFSNISKEQ